jgi:hypothetical protein
MTDRRRLLVLAGVDHYSRECLALVTDTSISGIRVLDEIAAARGRLGASPRTSVHHDSVHDQLVRTILVAY